MKLAVAGGETKVVPRLAAGERLEESKRLCKVTNNKYFLWKLLDAITTLLMLNILSQIAASPCARRTIDIGRTEWAFEFA